ncbi:MBOAT family O-acyltransferase [Mucisphaera calidilacus]|uniref:Peptidoglycan O-acetyltransferase n=1 Tax=Mucisphaera calidilacus TaxID=2527982 RepID=A0A518BY53_9BACT|nr:MBOAT family protein [Mucisphaera calidilacus]QDU71884.1 Peptidoglycan O-acetyltransferase [Mucisphaera calidilacus]
MLFNSVDYLIYLPLVCWVYYALPRSGRSLFLIGMSYLFYWWWSIPLSLLLVFSTVVDYSAALIIDNARHTLTRRLALLASLTANLGMLALFKYADFFVTSVNTALDQSLLPTLNLVLPLGISFYTFQTMSYTIDVFRGQLRASRNPLDVALYVCFFPQLVAGPIVRADTLIPQFRKHPEADWQQVRSGIAQILWGLAKKVYIADSMAHVANEAYSNPGQMSGLALVFATYAFAVQIYCDFSGYSDIAIGSARILGFELPVNFRSPYLACSIREFWRRWHISLSTWLRDYLYIPLGGNRGTLLRTQVNIMITMLLGGLWHGAGWNWVVWGGLQGLFMIAERLSGMSEQHPPQLFWKLTRWLVTFHLVCVSWVLFRAANLDDALVVFERIATLADGLSFDLTRPAAALAILLLAELIDVRRHVTGWIQRSPTTCLWVTLAAILILILTYKDATNPEFIYFQF